MSAPHEVATDLLEQASRVVVLTGAGMSAESGVADVALVVGTSSLVYPAANLPAVVSGRGGRVIEINPDETPLSPSVDLYWSARAGEALPRLAEALAGA